MIERAAPSTTLTTTTTSTATVQQPPPVPKRTFKGKIATTKQSTAIIDGSGSESFQYSQDFHTNREISSHKTSYKKSYNSNDVPEINTPSNFITTGDLNGGHISDDDRISLENSVFEELHPSDLLVMNNSGYSNRSSSDSNKSQTTVDTGYISSTTEYEKAFIPDSRMNYRSRFSSVDTQSSLDSCLTEKTMDSPLSKESFKLESGRSSSQNETPPNSAFFVKSPRALPAIPARKSMTAPTKIPPPALPSKPTRSTPPAPPLRSQQSIESGKLQNHATSNNSKLLSNFGRSTDNMVQDNVYNKAMTIRNKLSRGNKPPPISYPKLHQRQDSSISNDSFSITSSPGYNCKSMEAPLLQHASKINKNGLRHQDSNDSFVMTPRYNFQQQQTAHNKFNCRQDSNISSDSFSQTSSPGYSTKILEAPLLPHTLKICNGRPFINSIDLL